MPRKSMNLDGQRFGMLIVRHITDQYNSYGQRLHLCDCDCGRTRLASAANLRHDGVSSCGCKNYLPRKDISWTRFGRLFALYPDRPEARTPGTRTSRWICRCDCGRYVSVALNALVSGNSASCGCGQRDAVKGLYVDGTAPCKLTESKHPRKTNTSGVTGVGYDRARKLWTAEIIFRKKKYYLGRYVEKADAIAARKEAENSLFKDFLDRYNDEKKREP